jgi:hypothetical protein
MICLSVAGAFIAGMQYFAVDLLHQKSVTTPANGYNPDATYDCQAAWSSCMNSCGPVYSPGNRDCESQCNYALMICVNG